MPVPRVQQRDEKVDYIVVRRSESSDVDVATPPTSTVEATVNSSDDYPQPRTTSLLPRDDDDDDEDKDKGADSSSGAPSPLLVTMAIPDPQSTGAVADTDPLETVVVAIPPPSQPHPQGHKGGISQTTEHLLIAAGSIGATIILVMIALAIYTMRKRGLTLSQALKQGKYQVTRRGPPPPPKKAGNGWDTKQTIDSQIALPQFAMARSGSKSSQRPLLDLKRSDSFNLQSQKMESGDMREKSFFLEDPPPPRRNNSHRRDTSTAPSSPVLGQQVMRRSASTRNTRSMTEEPELKFTELSQERVSPLPPPPTFKQFLDNRPSISGKVGGGMVSRFSWTNSNAPQTPHDTHRDTNTHQIGRDSFMTSRSSVPRFRTVDSWVNQQTNRIEAQKLKEQFRLTATSTEYSGDDERDHIPEVPAMPKNVEELRENSAPMSASLPPRMPASPPLPPSGLPGKNIKHERHDTRTTVDTAPIFRQHPGTEVRFSTRSAVPSEILDRGRLPNVLS